METDKIRLPANAWKWATKYAREMRCLSNDAWHFGHMREWNRQLFTSSMRTEHTDISRRRFAETKGSDTEPISRFLNSRRTASPIHCAPVRTLRVARSHLLGLFTIVTRAALPCEKWLGYTGFRIGSGFNKRGGMAPDRSEMPYPRH